MNSFLVITDTPNIINRVINYLLIVMYSYDFYANKENRQKISCVLLGEGELQESHVYDVMYSKQTSPGQCLLSVSKCKWLV